MDELISKRAVIEAIEKARANVGHNLERSIGKSIIEILDDVGRDVNRLQHAQPDQGKYEYHYDHTDCIWYRPEARNRCPVTCAQYRDGWNDAMNYIFRDGKGYRPYRRGEQYEE